MTSIFGEGMLGPLVVFVSLVGLALAIFGRRAAHVSAQATAETAS